MKKPRLTLTLNTIVNDIRRDPLLFATQLYRRFSHPILTKIIATSITHTSDNRFSNFWANVIDRRDLEQTQRMEQNKRDKARALYRTGQLSQAIESLPTSSSLSKIWQSEKRTLEDTNRLVIPAMTPKNSHRTNHTSSRTIHVMHVLNSCLPFTQSGYTIRTHHLIAAQEKIDIRTYPITRPGYPVIIGHPFTNAQTDVDGITYHHILPGSIPLLPEERIAQHACELHHTIETSINNDISVIHATTDYINGLAAQAYAHSHNLPWVYEMRGMRELSWVATFPVEEQEIVLRSEKYQLWHAKETALARQADAVIVLSETQKKNLIERGVDEQSIWVVPHSYDIASDTPSLSPTEAQKELGLPEADVYFGSITSFVDYEGLDTLIHTVRILLDNGIKAQLVLVGSGISEAQLKALAHELAVDEHVIFPGKVPLDQSHLWYQSLDFFAVPRRDTPVCRLITPLKPFEALAYGRPLLTSHLPALDELTNHDVGFSIKDDCPDEWASTIASNMPTTQSYARMSSNALNFSRKITWEDSAKVTEQIYRKVCE